MFIHRNKVTCLCEPILSYPTASPRGAPQATRMILEVATHVLQSTRSHAPAGTKSNFRMGKSKIGIQYDACPQQIGLPPGVVDVILCIKVQPDGVPLS